jgi:hypothetical protein
VLLAVSDLVPEGLACDNASRYLLGRFNSNYRVTCPLALALLDRGIEGRHCLGVSEVIYPRFGLLELRGTGPV